MKETGISVFIQIGLPYLLLISLGPMFFLLHRKMNVCVERYIMRAIKKRFHVRILKHQHPRNPRYKQCHRAFGFGHVWYMHVRPGLLEVSLPQTISYEFEVEKRLKVRWLQECVMTSLPSDRYTLKALPRQKMVDINFEVFDRKKKSRLEVRIIRLQDDVHHRKYRLVTTWLS
ncbi:MAG: hypothetical protein RLZZ517_27 [Candidatus Parcubacteria bacterium]|jgi:hypothetical protein